MKRSVRIFAVWLAISLPPWPVEAQNVGAVDDKPAAGSDKKLADAKAAVKKAEEALAKAKIDGYNAQMAVDAAPDADKKAAAEENLKAAKDAVQSATEALAKAKVSAYDITVAAEQAGAGTPVAQPDKAQADAKAAVEAAASLIEPLRNPDIRHQMVAVDLTGKTALPSEVTVNAETGDAISLRITGSFTDTSTTLSVDGSSVVLEGSSLLIQFSGCKTRFARQIAKSRKLDRDGFCPVFLLKQPYGAIVLTDEKLDRDAAYIVVRGQDKEKKPTEVGIVIRMVKRQWGLAFSTGFFTFLREDDRYLATTTEDGKNKLLEKTSDAGRAYSLGVFSHYDFSRAPFALSFGFGSDVPVKELSVMAGLSYKLRTLPLGQSGYLTLGYALKPFSRLSPGLEKTFALTDATKRLLPATVTDASLTERRLIGTWFFGLSFVFAGKGESEFSGKLK